MYKRTYSTIIERINYWQENGEGRYFIDSERKGKPAERTAEFIRRHGYKVEITETENPHLVQIKVTRK